MTTIRGIQSADVTGPFRIHIEAAVGYVRVITQPGATAVRVELETAGDDGPAADAVKAADLVHTDYGIHVNVPGPYVTGTRNVVIGGNFAGGDVSFGTVINHGSGVVIGGHNFGTIVAGAVVAPGSHFGHGNVINAGGPDVAGSAFDRINITVTGPEGIDVQAIVDTVGSVDTHEAVLGSVTARTVQGEVRIGTAGNCTAGTVNGSIIVDTVTGDTARLDSKNGHILVDTAPAVDASTITGDITIRHLTGPAASRVKAISGSLRISGADGIQVDAHTVTGDIVFQRNLNVSARTTTGRVRAVD